VEEDFDPLLFRLSPLLAADGSLNPVDPAKENQVKKNADLTMVFTASLVEIGVSHIGFVVYNAH